MNDCPLINKCPFFNERMANTPAIIKIFKNEYCQGYNLKCARFLVFDALGKKKVPLNLYPNQTERAEEIIKETN